MVGTLSNNKHKQQKGVEIHLKRSVRSDRSVRNAYRAKLDYLRFLWANQHDFG